MPSTDEPGDRAPGGPASLVTPALLAHQRISFAGLVVRDGRCWWSRSCPEEGGRQVVEQGWLDPDRPVRRVSPPGMDVRSRVHEYGGGAFAVVAGGLAVVDAADGAIWWSAGGGDRFGGGDEPGAVDWRRVTPAAPEGFRDRYADLFELAGARALVAVRERSAGVGSGATAAEAVDEIVAVPLDGPAQAIVLHSGRDFYAAPRPSPGGDRLAFVCWDHPHMPWDGSELHVVGLSVGPAGMPGPWAGGDDEARLRPGGAFRVAGGPDEAVGQPQWVGDQLWFVSDRRGYWQPWTWTAAAGARPSCDEAADFHAPDWALGQRTMAPLGAEEMAVRFRRGGRDRVGVLDRGSGRLEEVAQPWVTVGALAADDQDIVVLGSTATEGTGIGVVSSGGGVRWVRAPSAPPLPVEAVSQAVPATVTGEDGGDVHVLVYRPAPNEAGVQAGTASPLMVLCHGGPTGAAEPGFDLQVQLWTSRGFVVAAVDYRGSSGYGRAYRRALDGRWGDLDAADVRAVARHLVALGEVDGRRVAVRGASAGGFTALRAATPDGPFRAAVVAYGVTDLYALAADTHKFESRYLDTLVGPLPGAEDRYDQRSPARHPEHVGAAVLLLQGADDPIVPPSQAAAMAGALRMRGIRCDLVVFPGEGHGFRRPETVRAAAAAELRFVGDVLDLGDLVGPGEELDPA
ncbi:MAG: prolyl oligopeptidase family serine peptidase [Actinomycetota bacterium]|nr:prolyl oligopeptidase family serine peptidase [Actinomycetota bacterium]MDA8279693.1 prolyl oligopeptidase family serine peptidase [Actinomycetota bacterium]